MSALASAPALVALVLLAVNDHVLKARFPGALSGKLSDVAGCFLLPLVVAEALALATRLSALARLAAGAAATVALLGAVKTSPAAAGAVAAALGAFGGALGLGPSRIVCDPTDLLALPLAGLAVAWGLRVERGRA